MYDEGNALDMNFYPYLYSDLIYLEILFCNRRIHQNKQPLYDE